MSIIRIQLRDIAEFTAVCRGLNDEGVTFTASQQGGYWEIEIKN